MKCDKSVPVSESRLPYLLPWVRVLLLIRSITSTTWGHEAWPEVKPVLRRALEMRRQIAGDGLVELNAAGSRTRSGAQLEGLGEGGRVMANDPKYDAALDLAKVHLLGAFEAFKADQRIPWSELPGNVPKVARPTPGWLDAVTGRKLPRQ